MIYNNKILPNQFISMVALLLGITFINTLFLLGCFYDWVSYGAGLFAILFIISSPAYFLGWKWSEPVLALAFFLFAGYNIYNVSTSVLDGDHSAYVSIPTALAGFMIIYYIFSNHSSKSRLKTLSFLNLVIVINSLIWGWMFIELAYTTIEQNFQEWIFYVATIWFLMLTLMSIAMLIFRRKFLRIILSVMMHLNAILIILMVVLNNDYSGIWLSSLLLLINFINILCLHSQEIKKCITIRLMR